MASHLQFWINVIKLGYDTGQWNLRALVCLGACVLGACVCVRGWECMFWCMASVLYSGVYPGIRSWTANAGLQAAAGECQQM